MKAAWVVAAPLLFATAAPAFAYEQTKTCSPSGGPFACEPGEAPKPVQWDRRCVVYYVNELGTTDIPGDPNLIHPLVLDAVNSGFDAWNNVQPSNLRVQYGGLTNEERAEYSEARGEDGNANVVVWRDSEWEYASTTAFAITSVTFDPVSGRIADADIELNGEYHHFTVGNAGVVVDVTNTITHEVGHFIGLDHSSLPEATMFGMAPEGETQKRTLHSDDIQGIVAIYPSDGTTPSCGEFPDYFEAPGVGSDDKGCCNGASSVSRRSPAPLVLVLLAVLVYRQRRREANEVIES